MGGSRTAEGHQRQAQQEKGVGFHNQGKGARGKILTMSCIDVQENGDLNKATPFCILQMVVAVAERLDSLPFGQQCALIHPE